MKGLKKIATAISILMLASGLSFDVSAQDTVPLVYINTGYISENDIAEVQLNIKNNIGISAYTIEVDYNPETLEFIDASQGNALEDGTFYCNGDYAEDAIRLVWSNSRNKEGDGTAAVLRFKTSDGTADMDTAISIGYSMLGDDLSECAFEPSDGELKIVSEIHRGDVNRDGDVDIADVVVINMYLLDKEKHLISKNSQANAEVSNDKIVNASDSALILNYVVMMIKEL